MSEFKRRRDVKNGFAVFADLDKFLRNLSLLVYEFKCRRAMKAMAGIVMEYLLINGQSISDICASGKYSKEDIDSLHRHLKEKRPHLLAALTSCVDIQDVLLETGRIPDGAGLDDFVERVKEALETDREEAAQDNCIWASVRNSGPVIREKWEKAAPNGTAGNQWATPNLYSQCLQEQYFFL
ncbi:uncharacterized protein NFIA_093520 [Aspergillus fischeri NRRL 181]|uniref:Uncharacterized protein n=1 Tax=Neosartorya fischeri (strain ATCC 1020 / DSM 3700 / CBS 544.65 / FGSC A1164 / JCM 1740 / NRRL 181 / WB 181) TaxID=331117 RepID=A1DJ27_NEOFI|nr:uncharacterized protein NFIA_093520 [Aspergillus fischeri NRRL 181]EAW19384.1 hypothetical protein NFIA_093520 [Aspergillus fischeri NRRL 181]